MARPKCFKWSRKGTIYQAARSPPTESLPLHYDGVADATGFFYSSEPPPPQATHDSAATDRYVSRRDFDVYCYGATSILKTDGASLAEEDKKPKSAPVGSIERIDEDIEEARRKISAFDREQERVAKARAAQVEKLAATKDETLEVKQESI
ncbi:hypothetical protein DL764_009521 [Monosporascus ibericus]|uniref:Uncharacterized protein n=1 Tax=Monosporascus ibericus TaxID=155417 RepID=A0A4Q4SWU6_9PEZI|nr:hypothetical protein DL764_009521 [Monosporascus ibericus]